MVLQKLKGVRIFVPFVNEGSKSTRPDKHIRALLEAGATVEIVGQFPDWLVSRLSYFENVNFVRLDSLGREFVSRNRIWLIRVFMNLTWNRLMRKLFPNLTLFEKLVKPGRHFRPHVVLCFNPPCLRIARSIAIKTRAKLIYDSGEFWPEYAKHPHWSEHPDLIRRHLNAERDCIGDAALVVATSDEMRRRIKDHYRVRSCITFFNSQADPTLERCIPAHNPVRFVFHGMLGADRNLLNLIKAMRDITGATLDIYGDFYSAEDGERLRKELDENLKEKVVLHGSFTQEDIQKFLPSYDVGIYPAVALDENFNITLPNKIFDCILSGLALAVPPFRSIEQIIEVEKNGVIIDTLSPKAMSRDLQQLVNAPMDISRMKEASFGVASKYSRSAQTAKLIAAYKEALS